MNDVGTNKFILKICVDRSTGFWRGRAARNSPCPTLFLTGRKKRDQIQQFVGLILGIFPSHTLLQFWQRGLPVVLLYFHV